MTPGHPVITAEVRASRSASRWPWRGTLFPGRLTPAEAIGIARLALRTA